MQADGLRPRRWLKLKHQSRIPRVEDRELPRERIGVLETLAAYSGFAFNIAANNAIRVLQPRKTLPCFFLPTKAMVLGESMVCVGQAVLLNQDVGWKVERRPAGDPTF